MNSFMRSRSSPFALLLILATMLFAPLVSAGVSIQTDAAQYLQLADHQPAIVAHEVPGMNITRAYDRLVVAMHEVRHVDRVMQWHGLQKRLI